MNSVGGGRIFVRVTTVEILLQVREVDNMNVVAVGADAGDGEYGRTRVGPHPG